MFKSLGKALGMDDLMVTGLYKLPQKALKRMIRRRLKSGYWKKAVPIPGVPLTTKSRLNSLKLFNKS